jgi:two-component sensor histidine kinase/ABC-type amino acid transport substrate-binding protein
MHDCKISCKMNPKKILLLFILFIFISVCLFSEDLQLSQGELQWLKEHSRLKVGVGTSFNPVMYVQQDEDGYVFKGIVSDYLDVIGKKLGIEFEIQYGITFEEAMQAGRNREIDLFPCVAKNVEREEFLVFTQPYLSYPIMIFSNMDTAYIGGMNDLQGRTVADVEVLYLHTRLETDYPGINFLLVDTIPDALEAVALGEADACITNLAVGSYLIQKNGWTNVKVSAPSGYENSELSMAVRDDWPELIPILEKATGSMTQADKNAINQKWIAGRYEYGIDPAIILKRTLLILGIAAFLVSLFIFWNRKLQGEIRERKKTEAAQKEAEAELKNLLEEKDILLREIHHRVKNNLSMVASLLSLHSLTHKGDIDNSSLQDLGLRIESIAMVHEMLQNSSSMLEINMQDYLPKLVNNIIEGTSRQAGLIEAENDIQIVCFNSDTAIPLGMIVTELLTNSLKYAFPENRAGRVSISLKKTDNNYQFAFSDNGISLPDGYDISQSSSLGLKLVSLLVKQLGGIMKINTESGLGFIITFS